MLKSDDNFDDLMDEMDPYDYINDNNYDVLASKLYFCNSTELEQLYFFCFSKKRELALRIKLFKDLLNVTGPNFVFAPQTETKFSRHKKIAKKKYSLLHVSILSDEIIFFCQLMKRGVNINVYNDDGNIIHFCVANEKYDLTKFFIKKNININEFNDEGLTPLYLAIIIFNYEIAKMLIENGADFFLHNNRCMSPIHIFIMSLKSTNTDEQNANFLSFFEFILKNTKLNFDDEDKIVEILMKKRKFNLLTKMCEIKEDIITKHNVLQNIFFSCEWTKYGDENHVVVSNMLDLKNCQIVPKKDGNSIFNNCINTCKYEILEKILQLNPNIVKLEKENYENNKHEVSFLYSTFEYLFSNYHLFVNGNFATYTKTCEGIMKFLKLLFNYGLDINEKIGGILPVEFAIQYRDDEFMKEFIKLGCNIYNLDIDLLECSIKYMNILLFKFLLEKDIAVHYVDEKKLIPLCMLCVIQKDDVKLFKYCYKKLIKHDKMKDDDETRKALAQLIMDESLVKTGKLLAMIDYFDVTQTIKLPSYILKYTDENNMSEFLSEIRDFCKLFIHAFFCENSYDLIQMLEEYDEFINSISQKEDTFKSIINVICFYCNYQNNYYIESHIYSLNNIVKSKNEDANHYEDNNLNNMFSHNYFKHKNIIFKAIANFYFQVIDSHKYSLNKMVNLIGYINLINSEYHSDSSDCDCCNCNCNIESEEENNSSDDENTMLEDEIVDSVESGQIDNNRFGIFRNNKKKKDIVKNQKNDTKKKSKTTTKQKVKKEIKKEIKKETNKKTTEYDQFVTSKLNEEFIKKSLFKLNFPTKVQHYDYVFNSLLKEPVFSETNDSIVFTDDNKIYIFDKSRKSFNKKPSRWIKYYSQNIGSEDKQNFEHDFPFWIDKIIYNLNCYEDETKDINNTNENTKMIYFSGSIIYNDIKYDGLYEYFISGTGTLFHRMFRKITKLKNELKCLISQ